MILARGQLESVPDGEERSTTLFMFSSIELPVRASSHIRREQRVRRVIDAETFRLFPREEPRQKVGAVGGQFQERLVHQVLDHVLPADVDDECNARLKSRNIGEVLIGSDAKIDAAWRPIFSSLSRTWKVAFISKRNCPSGSSLQARKSRRPFSRMLRH